MYLRLLVQLITDCSWDPSSPSKTDNVVVTSAVEVKIICEDTSCCFEQKVDFIYSWQIRYLVFNYQDLSEFADRQIV